MPEPWGFVEDTGNHLGIPTDSVDRRTETKGLPAHRTGRLWKAKLSEIERWVNAEGVGQDEGKENA